MSPIPHDMTAEQAVLGGMLLAQGTVAETINTLTSDDFYEPKHANVFDAIVSLYTAGSPTDPIAVVNLLSKNGDLLRIGGGPYIHTLVESVPLANSISHYRDIVREKSLLRQLFSAAQRIQQLALAGEGEAANIVAEAQSIVTDITKESASRSITDLTEHVADVLERVEQRALNPGQIMGIPTGYNELDETTDGLQGGQLVIVGGRPAQGKSLIATDIARHVAFKEEKHTLLFSLEMSASEVVERVISAESLTPHQSLRTGSLTDSDWLRIAKSNSEWDKTFHIDDSPGITLPEIIAKAKHFTQQYDVGVILVDYLQLMSTGRRLETRQLEVAECSRGLKLLAKSLNIPIVATAQLNRSLDSRSDKRPQLSDLRESGSIEADADIVILIHHPDTEDNSRSGEVELHVAKNRMGPTGVIPLLWRPHIAQLSNFTEPATVN